MPPREPFKQDMNEEFYKSWFFIQLHPKFLLRKDLVTFPHGLDIMVVKVNPETKSVDDDESKNTKLQIWLEYGPYKGDEPTHDIDLDCGADTFEEAIIELAKLVEWKYGKY